MHDRLSRLSSREVALLQSLGPHTRAHVLQLLSAVPDLTLTSARRTPSRNRQVGGAPRSFHLAGRAADFTGPERALQAGHRFARKARVGSRCTGPEEALIHNAGSGRHLHVAW